MSIILENRRLSDEYYFMKVEHKNNAKMGQFYMLRSWGGSAPLLSRPISIFDRDETTVSFLYKVVGVGTEIMKNMKVGDKINILGPYGNSFPEVEGKIAMVGGGVGIAPLYFASKVLKENPNNHVDIFFGLRNEEILRDELTGVCHNLLLKVDGRVNEEFDYDDYDYVFTCGPEPMMIAVYECSKGKKAKVYVSMERHMGCGIGICYVCTCHTKHGNKLVCKDGPVFLGEDVYDV